VAVAAVERLDSVQANLIGAMLNRVVLNSHDKSYLPYYHREYKAYDREQEDTFIPADLPPRLLNDRPPGAPASVEG
jgi:hypothetical protein